MKIIDIEYDNEVKEVDTSDLLYRFRGSLHGWATITKEEYEYIGSMLKRLNELESSNMNLIEWLNNE